jgi:hypothetical protein
MKLTRGCWVELVQSCSGELSCVVLVYNHLLCIFSTTPNLILEYELTHTSLPPPKPIEDVSWPVSGLAFIPQSDTDHRPKLNILPPPPPILPPLCASLTSHSRKKSLFRISSGRVRRVSNCASCLLKARRVGILLICTVHLRQLLSKSPFPTTFRFPQDVCRWS